MANKRWIYCIPPMQSANVIALFKDDVQYEMFNVGTGIETSANQLKDMIFAGNGKSLCRLTDWNTIAILSGGVWHRPRKFVRNWASFQPSLFKKACGDM